MISHQLAKWYIENQVEAGCDEAGRGCLAGPVFAAAVILPKDFPFEFLDDSKKLSRKQRELARKEIESKAMAWCVEQVEADEIDEINILNASILAMHKALTGLAIRPDFILVDGNRFKIYHDIPHLCMIKGDGRFASIAAASILAKTHRDDFMLRLSAEFPDYAWNKNKGYPTQEHIRAIDKYGQTEWHRKTFVVKKQLSLDF